MDCVEESEIFVKMLARIVLLCIVGLAIGVRQSESLGDSNYPIFNPDDGLPSLASTDTINKILSLSEQMLKRIEAVDYK